MTLTTMTPPQPGGATWHIRSLGLTEVKVAGESVQFGASSAQTLFWYLHSHPDGAARARILSDVWQQNETAATLNRFRVALCRLRSALGTSASVQEHGGRYRLSPEVIAASDTAQLSALLEQAQQVSGNAQKTLLSAALELSRGEYLPDLQGEWLDDARNHWREMQVRAHLSMARLHCLERACPLAALELRAALETDPYQPEDLHQRLMICLNRSQGKYASIAHYRRFLHFLRTEIHDTPMQETVNLAEQIKNDDQDCQSWPAPLRDRPAAFRS